MVEPVNRKRNRRYGNSLRFSLFPARDLPLLRLGVDGRGGSSGGKFYMTVIAVWKGEKGGEK